MSRPLGRARALLDRPGAWIEAMPGGYGLRLAPDRRRRVDLRLTEADFAALADAPGLAVRPGGGWRRRTPDVETVAPRPGRPGVIEGELTVMSPDGRAVTRRANLGETPVAWLARRKDGDGRPWLTRAEAVAGERLRMDAEAAGSGPSLTMRWDALPRSAGGSAARMEPGDRALAASRRVQTALSACDPQARAIVEHICIRGSALQLAETDLGLRRRTGRELLRRGLAALARHYRLA